MVVRFSGACAILAVASTLAAAQTFTPTERQLLMQPTTIGAAPGTFTQPAKPESKKDAKAPAKRDAPAVSISSELNRSSNSASAPALKKPREVVSQTPFDQRIPFGPLSLGLQAESSPRSDSLTTPTPNGINQFKKDRAEPYVGVSIIEIKR